MSDVFRVWLDTRNDTDLIRISSSESPTVMVHGMGLDLPTQDIAERFAKAMKHAVELCSEKKSLF